MSTMASATTRLMQTRKVIKWLFVIDRYFALSFKGTLRFVLSFIKNEGTRNKFCASLDKSNFLVVVSKRVITRMIK